jgi:signal transduction histidine kinase/CheY-like chemotaxis protein
VVDTGIGIEPSQFTAIFGSFEQAQGNEQREYSGTGLGLSVSKQLIELHGGQIDVSSTLGLGSCFTFTLPIAVNVSTEVVVVDQVITRLHMMEDDAFTDPHVSNDGGKFRILLVDDEPINRQVLFNHLSLKDYQLVEASGGKEALRAIDEDGPFDLVLLDIMMPKISGYEVCQRLRELHAVSDLPVIFLTAKNQVADLVQSFAVGANDYLSKPVSKHELLTRVETHLKLLDINRNLEKKVVERTKELERSNQTITALSEISSEISSTLELNTLVKLVYHRIKELMRVDVFGIGLYKPKKHGIEFKLAIDNERMIPTVFIAMSEKDRPAVWCIENLKPMIINNIEQDFGHFFTDIAIPKPKVGEQRGSQIYWPLMVGSKVIGILTVQSFDANVYNEHQQDMICTLAATTAIALDNANAYGEIEKQKLEVEAKNAEIMAAQQQLVQSEKMASLGILTAGVAHEINNPTNFVDVSAQNMQKDLENLQEFILELAGEDADQEILSSFGRQFAPLFAHVSTIKEGTERIQSVVKDLRVFSQLDAAAKKTVVITECLQSTINLVRTKNHHFIQFDTDFAERPSLSCYPAQLNQVFMNLIVNACDAIVDSMKLHPANNCEKTTGTIVVGCQLIGNGKEPKVEITVKDNGIGMNEKTKNKFFEPFYTTKAVGQGTGLGLSIAYGIVQQHQGELTVESELGKGSLFRLVLPVIITA